MSVFKAFFGLGKIPKVTKYFEFPSFDDVNKMGGAIQAMKTEARITGKKFSPAQKKYLDDQMKQVEIVFQQIKSPTTKSPPSGIRNTEPAKIFDLQGKEIPKGSKIMGGKEVKETEAEIAARLLKENKMSVGRLRKKKIKEEVSKVNDQIEEMMESGVDENNPELAKLYDKQNDLELDLDLENMMYPDPTDFADGGVAGLLGERTGYNKGLKVQGSGKISGKQDMYSTGEKSAIKLPEGITSNTSFINFIANLDIPISEKISLLGDVQYNKSRNRIQKDDQEIFMEDPASSIDRKIGIGYDSGTGITGSAKYGMDDEGFMLKIAKSFAQGGPARQNFAFGRRAFLKLLAGTGAGIGAAKSGLFSLLKGGGKKQVVKELATSAGSGTPPPYFFKLVEKIKKLGDDVTETAAVADRQKVHQYKDFEMTEDIATGKIEIQKQHRNFIDDETPYNLSKESYMSYTPGEVISQGTKKGKNKIIKTADDYVEDTTYMRNDGPNTGGIHKVEDGVPQSVLDEVEIGGGNIDFPVKKASGGRVPLFGGGAALKVWQNFVARLFKKEMTKPTWKRLHPGNKDWAKRQVENYNKKMPALTKQFEEFKKTGKLPEDMGVHKDYFSGYDTKKLRKKEVDYDYYREILDDAENDIVQGDETLEALEGMVKEKYDYHDYMYDQYKTGKLDKYMSMEAKGKRVLDADDAGRPSGYNMDEEYEIRAAMDEAERIKIAKMNEADELAKSKESPWFTDPKILSPEDQLRKEFPGIDDNMIRNILTDTNPQRIAEVKQTLREALEMQGKGMGHEEIIQTFKKTKPTKHATGGRVPLGRGGGLFNLLKLLKSLKPKPKLSYLEKYPRIDIKELMKGDKKIKLYSGVGDRQANTLKAYKKSAKDFGVTPEIVAKDNYKGQWFTPFKEYASSFGNKHNIASKMLTTELTPKEIKMALRYVEKINKTNYLAHPHLPTKKPRYPVTTDENTVLIPKIKLKKLKKEGKIDTDYMILDKIKNKLGLSKGGLAGMLGE